MYIIRGAPRLTAKGHNLVAEECHGAARACFIESAFLRGSAQERVRELGCAYRAAGHGHAFRAEELRYDARGGMTEKMALLRAEGR